MKKLLALVLSAIVTLSCLMLCVGAEQNAAKSSDPVVLISRMEKYEKYQSSIFWRGKLILKRYGDCGSIGTYISSEYILDPVGYDEYYKSEVFKTGLPSILYWTKYYNFSRDTFDKAIKQYFNDKGAPYTSAFTDAIFSGNDRTAMEAFMFPEYVIDMDVYNSTEPKARDVSLISDDWNFIDHPMMRDPGEIIEEPLEKLEGWGYSDAYWLDYYEFIRYLNKSEHEWEDRIAWSAYLAEEEIVELDRRIEIYRARVGSSPDTGDGTAARAAVFAAGAVLAAVVPALILTVKRRRDKE